MNSFCVQEEELLYHLFSPAPPLDIVTGISDENSPIIARTSAFERYFRPLNPIPKRDVTSINVHRRVISLLESIWKKSKPNRKICNIDIGGGSREFRHMMRERHRRERLSENYSELYSILAPTSKADKNSIVQSAAAYLKELKTIKEKLYRQNKELRERMNALGSIGLDLRSEEEMEDDDNMRIEEEVEVEEEEKKIEVRLRNPVSTMDSMIEALQCMKGMGVTATRIQSGFYEDEFTTTMIINTTVEKSEVKAAVEGTLVEMERKLRLQLHGSGMWAPTSTTSPCGELRTCLDPTFN